MLRLNLLCLLYGSSGASIDDHRLHRATSRSRVKTCAHHSLPALTRILTRATLGSVLSFQRGFLFSAWTGGDQLVERAVMGNLGKWLIVDTFFLWVADTGRSPVSLSPVLVVLLCRVLDGGRGSEAQESGTSLSLRISRRRGPNNVQTGRNYRVRVRVHDSTLFVPSSSYHYG